MATSKRAMNEAMMMMNPSTVLSRVEVRISSSTVRKMTGICFTRISPRMK